MTSIGKFVVAGAAATQESTLALANINFDFSLLKMEAPMEYRGLGSALSSKRKRDAEEGSSHITARKLGALFADDLPHIPNLSRAYGLRVSEIAENPKYNPHGTPADGPFMDNVGADGTSIWAAATSGRGALAVHLLACLLARGWTHSEAVSIWSEIIIARKAVLQARMQEREFNIGMVTACQIDVDRDRLAEWDASARSWLRTADTAKKLQQTQLMLIIDNMNLPMPSKITVYDEVMNVWYQAMITADKLIAGMAQSVQSGDTLFGLCAWHIYPDICAIETKTTMIEQHDNLVKKGGLMTIGLCSTKEDPRGISWSMPLAHLRFYGKPVMSHAAVGLTSSRVSFDRIVQITIGCIVSCWESSHVDLTRIADFFVVFESSLVASITKILSADKAGWTLSRSEVYTLQKLLGWMGDLHPASLKDSWPALLSRRARRFLKSGKDEQQNTARYIALGRRRYGTFLGKDDNHPSPFFGLSDTSLYIQMMAPEKRVAKLRDMARLFMTPDRLNGAIIRLYHSKDSMGHQLVEYATLVPQPVAGTSRKTHRRWVMFPTIPDEDSSPLSATYKAAQREAIQRSLIIMKEHAEPCGFLHTNNVGFSSRYTLPNENMYPKGFSWLNRDNVTSVTHLMERSNSWADDYLPASQRRLGWQMGLASHSYGGGEYRYLYGMNSGAAVFHRSGFRLIDFSLPAQYIIDTLSDREFDTLNFVDHFASLLLAPALGQNRSDYFASLFALAKAEKIYATLPQAEVDLAIFSKPLCASNWARALLDTTDVTPNERTVSLACVAHLDTGYLDLHVPDFDDVLAISSADSLYAPEFLFCDPCLSHSRQNLRHIVGNVGKPGLALLLSPQETILRERDLDTWQLVSHSEFDGRFEDNFASTTMHLILTGHEQRLNTQRHSPRDKEAFYLEAVVSVYDKGVWMADLDLLHLIRGPQKFLQACDLHDEVVKQDFSTIPGLTAIDNWYEYLDRPPNTAIIRANKNWVARLAFAAIPLKDEEALIIGSEQICWACAKACDRDLGSESLVLY